MSFESDSAPVLTHREEIAATNAQKAASLAVKAARKVFRGKSPRSIVIVLEEVGRVQLPRSEEARADDEYFRSGARYPGQ